MFTYSWVLTLYAILLILPSITVTKYLMTFYMQYNMKYQNAKGDVTAIAQETISNVRTVKAFADESGSVKSYKK